MDSKVVANTFMGNLISTQMNILKNKDHPNSAIYIDCIFSNFIELSGDRIFGDDSSIVGGVALLNDFPVTVIGQLRGRNLEEQIKQELWRWRLKLKTTR